MRIDSTLLEKLDEIAEHDYKRRSDVIRDALSEYVKHQVEMDNIRKMLVTQFLEGKITFDEIAHILGLETARDLEMARSKLKESIESAKRDSK